MGEIDSIDAEPDDPRATGLSALADICIVGGSSGQQKGFAHSWRARSINLTGLSGAGDPKDAPDEEIDEIDLPPAADALRARLRRLLQPPVELLLDTNGPLAWPHRFFGYQQAGISTLIRSRHLLLGDEMGLGKTVQAIAAVRILIHMRRVEHVLVVCPAGLVDQWMRAIGEWAPELSCIAVVGPANDRAWRWSARCHVTVAAYDTLRSDRHESGSFSDIVILDEAQKIKNPESRIASICKDLPRRRSWAVTGTPLENKIEDLDSILDFVLARPAKIDSIQRALTLLSLTQVRRRKRDVLADLPPKIVTEVPVELSTRQRIAYDRAEQEGIVKLREIEEITIPHVFALIVRLKQICNFDPETGASSKLDDLRERIAEIAENGNKALVFSQFTDDSAGVRRIARGLAEFAPLVYTGAMDRNERALTLRRFDQEDECPVLVVSLKAGGSGLNLQRASYVFHFDRWWNPAVESQAEDRVHRIGQTQSVNVYKYIVAHTIEQRIDELIRDKQQLFQTVVDESGISIPPHLTKLDLLSLVEKVALSKRMPR